MDAIAFAYANEWIAFDDIVRWGEDQEVEDDYLLLVGARDVCPDRSLGVMQCEPMRLWLLRPHTEVLARGRSPWRPWFEKVFGVVVRASSEEEARALAHSEAGSEGLGIYQGLGLASEQVAKAVWLDPLFTACDRLLEDGPPAVILVDRREA